MRRKRIYGRRRVQRSPLKHPIEQKHSHHDDKVIFPSPLPPPDKVDYTKKPKIIYEDEPGAEGSYSSDENIIRLNPKYKKSVSDIMKMGPNRAKEMFIKRGEVYRHEKKHYDQLLKEGKENLRNRYIGDETKALESHMDPFVHSKEHRQKKDWEVHPEVKTAKKYQNINPALEQITVDRYSDWWSREGQYITKGTVEYEAEEAAYTRKGKQYKKPENR